MKWVWSPQDFKQNVFVFYLNQSFGVWNNALGNAKRVRKWPITKRHLSTWPGSSFSLDSPRVFHREGAWCNIEKKKNSFSWEDFLWTYSHRSHSFVLSCWEFIPTVSHPATRGVITTSHKHWSILHFKINVPVFCNRAPVPSPYPSPCQCNIEETVEQKNSVRKNDTQLKN